MPETVRDWTQRAVAALAPLIGAEEAARDARRLLAAATGWSAARLQAEEASALSEDASARADGFLARRMAREPTAQILGAWEFYGRRFAVGRDVLTPRPDTETLIEHALRAPFVRVLDLGTGSGILAVTLLAERTRSTGRATDISPRALALARANAEAHGVRDRLALSEGSWWAAVPGGEAFDLIVSNPPYVSARDYATLAPEILDFEPPEALTPGGDGLSPYAAILEHARARLASGGRLLVEIGHDQGAAVSGMFRRGGLENVSVHADLNGHDRVVEGHAPSVRER